MSATFEYVRVPWEQVEVRAAEGWRLMEIPPMPETKVVLGQMGMTGVVFFFMEREAGKSAAASGPPVLVHGTGRGA